MSFTDSGNGFQLPYDSNTDQTGVAFQVRQIIARLSTMRLCKVTAVTGGGVGVPPTISAQMLVNQIDGATPPNPTPRGIATNVPVARLSGGMNAIICDPQVGDIGYLVASDRDISVVKKSWAQGNPGSSRRFSYSDSVYQPMGAAITPNQYVYFTSTGIRIADSNGNLIQMSSAGIILNGVTIDRSGNISTPGTISDASGSLSVHVHSGVQTGSSNTGPRVG